MTHLRSLLLVITILASLCTYATSAIYGDNDRYSISSDSYPKNMIGVLLAPTGEGCTASLVGVDLILTAAHCLINTNNQLTQGTYTFYLGLENNYTTSYSEISEVYFGSKTIYKTINGKITEPRNGRDWAILRLKKHLGKNGYLDVKNVSANSTKGQYLNFAGYGSINSDNGKLTDTLWVQNGCKFKGATKDDFNRVLYRHDCDVGDGDSGGPIYYCEKVNQRKKCYITAIYTSSHQRHLTNGNIISEFDEYSYRYSNFAVPVSTFTGQLTKLKNN